MIRRCGYLLPDRSAARYRHRVNNGGQRGRSPRGLYRSTGRSHSLVHHKTVVRVDRDGERSTCRRPRRGIHDTRLEWVKPSRVSKLNRIDIVANYVSRIRIVRLDPILPVRGGRRVSIFSDYVYRGSAGRERGVERFLGAIDASDSCSSDGRVRLAVAHECRAARCHVGL